MNANCHHIAVELHHGVVIEIDTRAEVVRAMTRALQGRVYRHGEVLNVVFVGLMAEDAYGACWAAETGVTPSIKFETDDATGVISMSWHNWADVPKAARDWANLMVAEAWSEATSR